MGLEPSPEAQFPSVSKAVFSDENFKANASRSRGREDSEPSDTCAFGLHFSPRGRGWTGLPPDPGRGPVRGLAAWGGPFQMSDSGKRGILERGKCGFVSERPVKNCPLSRQRPKDRWLSQSSRQTWREGSY